MSLEGSSNIKVNALKEMNTDGISHEKIVKEKQNNIYTFTCVPSCMGFSKQIGGKVRST